jgi:hypothetical protein
MDMRGGNEDLQIKYPGLQFDVSEKANAAGMN